MNEDIVGRLRFAIENLDREKVDKIAKQYLLEHQLLGTRFAGTVK